MWLPPHKLFPSLFSLPSPLQWCVYAALSFLSFPITHRSFPVYPHLWLLSLLSMASYISYSLCFFREKQAVAVVEVWVQLKIVITPVPKPPKPVDACVVAPKAGAAGLAAPKSPPPAGWAAPNAVVPVGIVFKMSINSSIDSSFFQTSYDLKGMLSTSSQNLSK